MFSISVNSAPTIRSIRKLMSSQPETLARAINYTAEDANAAIRDEMQRQFTIRDPNVPRYVAPRQLPKPDRATKERPVAILKTQGKGRLLAPFEKGIPKRALSADRPVAIPTRFIRSSPDALVPKRWYPQNLGLTPRKDPAGKTYYALGKNAIRDGKTPIKRNKRGRIVQIQGKHSTFVLDPRHHEGVSMRQWGVYVRIGKAKGDIKMIWRYVNQVPRPSILAFEATALRVVAERFHLNYQGMYALALRRAG